MMNNSIRSNVSEASPATNALIVNYLPYNLSEQEFHAIFVQFGALNKTQIIRDHMTGKSRGYGFVYFQQASDAAAALDRLQDFQLYSRRISIAYAKKRHSATSGPSTPAYGLSQSSDIGNASTSMAMDV